MTRPQSTCCGCAQVNASAVICQGDEIAIQLREAERLIDFLRWFAFEYEVCGVCVV